MGTDINGFIECRAWFLRDEDGKPAWQAAVALDLLNTTRNYDAFGCLFGVRNHANFRPLAADRGLPPDASQTVRAAVDTYGTTFYGTTWITWAEVRAVDWAEAAEAPDSRLHEYRRTPDGLTLVGKSAWNRRFGETLGIPEPVPTPGPGSEPGEVRTWPEGSEWVVDDIVYRSERMDRRDAVREDGEWKPVWTVMEALASQHGDDNVRLVVWFDY
ncbi:MULTISPECIES: hypothetical protein [Streptomycetaceae]|uniref:hypothetical protein n=1 Tax=Streptomycetaceae TaxID=2062 RepID=UPI00093A0312|nr:hypothetical protein [Streptomyces sp. CB02056]OKI01732.1 hypothetical protein AMK13_31200 [Streptomyces sp. CB02056]